MRIQAGLIAVLAAGAAIACGDEENVGAKPEAQVHAVSGSDEGSGASLHSTETEFETVGGAFPLVRRQ